MRIVHNPHARDLPPDTTERRTIARHAYIDCVRAYLAGTTGKDNLTLAVRAMKREGYTFDECLLITPRLPMLDLQSVWGIA